MDIWTKWLLERRHGGDEEAFRQTMEWLKPVRDKVLEHAALAGDETLLDVGCGDGLIGFGALEKLDAGQVIFSDVSQDLLAICQSIASEMNVLDRCQFVQADAAALTPIADSSVHVVTTRSVLIYVKDKRGAFDAFYRVLKPAGILSIFEPINTFAHADNKGSLWGIDVTPVADLAAKVRAVYAAIQPPGEDPMLDFDERDLFRLAEAAGFREVEMEYYARALPTPPREWEQMIHVAANPRVPTLHEAMDQVLTPDERQRVEAHLRPLVEKGGGTHRAAIAYLWARK